MLNLIISKFLSSKSLIPQQITQFLKNILKG